MTFNQVLTSADVILSSPRDWELWYTILKDKANMLEVWEYVDPDRVTPQPCRPESPKFSDVKEGATHCKDLLGPDNDLSLFNLYEFAWTEWEEEVRAYDRIHAGLLDISEYIRTTVATGSFQLIKYKTNQEGVKILKACFAPEDYVSRMAARVGYLKALELGASLERGPTK
jgi:hypothetical protein